MREATKAIHAIDELLETDPFKPIEPPIYRSVIYKYPRESGKIREKPVKYGREDNPTIYMLERIITALEEGEDTLTFATGMAATSTTFLALLKPGDVVVACREAYGTTLVLLRELEQWGVKVELADPDTDDLVEKIISFKPKLVFTESITNPLLHVIDIPEVAKACRDVGAILVVDNTFATPVLMKPLKMGAKAVIHSLTKYMGGHNDVLGGSLTSNKDVIEHVWWYRRMLGTIMDPGQAYLVIRGLKTLELRVKRHCENAKAVAEFLNEHPKVKEVLYPGLPSSPSYSVAVKLLPRGMYGGVVSFRIRGGRLEVERFFSKLRIVKPSPSLGGPESLIAYPVASSHAMLPEDERRRLGITEDLVRLSVGLEDVNDIIEDLDQALSSL